MLIRFGFGREMPVRLIGQGQKVERRSAHSEVFTYSCLEPRDVELGMFNISVNREGEACRESAQRLAGDNFAAVNTPGGLKSFHILNCMESDLSITIP